MNGPPDKIRNVHWEGPFKWTTRAKKTRKRHVLYAIFGTHAVYGPNSLLYIGRSEGVSQRLHAHDKWWVVDESDPVSLYLGSVSRFENWRSSTSSNADKPADSTIVAAIEVLLIHAHQPAYNSQSLEEPKKFHAIRVFNSGRHSTLLPEISYRCYRDP